MLSVQVDFGDVDAYWTMKQYCWYLTLTLLLWQWFANYLVMLSRLITVANENKRLCCQIWNYQCAAQLWVNYDYTLPLGSCYIFLGTLINVSCLKILRLISMLNLNLFIHSFIYFEHSNKNRHVEAKVILFLHIPLYGNTTQASLVVVMSCSETIAITQSKIKRPFLL